MKEERKIRVATLNYSGIITSPFEYHEDPKDEEQIIVNETFISIVKKYHDENYESNKFKWEMGNIDVIWKTRLSPINKILCGVQLSDEEMENYERQLRQKGKIDLDRRMMTLDQYSKLWDSRLESSLESIRQFYHQKFSKQQPEERMKLLTTHLDNTKKFDILAFRTFAKIIYGTEEIETWDEPAQKWIEVRTKQFDKIYLDDDRKKHSTLEVLQKGQYDLFCFQETNENFRELLRTELKTYWVRQFKQILSCDSIIVIKKETFPEITCYDDLDQFNHKFIEEHCKIKAIFTTKVNEHDKEGLFFDKYANQQHFNSFKEELIWNKDTAYQVFNSLIVFCPHITSKKEANEIQQEQMFQHLLEIKKYNPEYSYICTGDLNSEIKADNKFIKIGSRKSPLNIFPPPGSPGHITCNKQRTMVQPQRHKAEKLDMGTKDYIMTDLQMQESKIIMINGEEIRSDGKKALLPNNSHPYDHYISTCVLLQPFTK